MKNNKRIFISGWILVLAVFGMAGNSRPSSASDDSKPWFDSASLASEPWHEEGSVGSSLAFNGPTDDRPAIEDIQEDMGRFFKAKELVFKHDWRAARTGFESYLKDFPKGRMRDEALYWLAQSLNYLARNERGREAISRLKKTALDEIQKLVDAHPESLWRDDALALRVEIAGELVLLGDISYQKYITEAVETGTRSSRDLKLQALGSLVDLDPKTALPIIRRILKTEGDVEVRRCCLSLALRFPAEDAGKILDEAARSDRDEKIRSEAASFAEQITQSRIPVRLRYFIYESKLIGNTLNSNIPEGRAKEYLLDRSAVDDTAAILGKVKGIFGKGLSIPLHSANGQLPFSPSFSRFSTLLNGAGDFLIWIKPSALKITSERIAGEIEFRNRVTNEIFDQTVSVDRSADKLLAARSGDRVALLIFQFARLDSTRDSVETAREKAAPSAVPSDEPGYGPFKAASMVTLHAGVQVHTEKTVYDLHSFEKNLIDLEYAEAEIYPGGMPSLMKIAKTPVRVSIDVPGAKSISRNPWVLLGDLFYFKDQEKLLGFGASLFNPESELMAEGLIEVPAGDPAGFKVLRGRRFENNRKIVTAPDEKKTRPIFSTQWPSYMGWNMLTSQSASAFLLKAAKRDFGLARADRHFDGRDWILMGQIISHEKERKFIARQAALIASDGTIIHGAEIHVNVDKPADCVVVVK